MTQEHPFQASIVGLGTMPEPYYGKWSFLENMAKSLHPTEAIRLILPLPLRTLRPDIRWGRICKKMGVIPRSSTKKINTNHYHLYLWYENGNSPRKA